MKKYILILSIHLLFSGIYAQDVIDAVRLGQDNLKGTARFRAMSGAFGALGGDLSAINVNPAGSVIFANNQLAFSIGNFNTDNDSNYFGTKTNDSKNSVDFNQAGGVFVFDNYNSKSDWKKFAVAINYENGLLNNNTFSAGINTIHSIDSYFLNYANANAYQGGIFLGTLLNSNYGDLNYADQQAFLGYNSYIINPIPLVSDPTNYSNVNISSYGTTIFHNPESYSQQNSVIAKGYNGKLSFNAAAQYQDWLSIGLNLNSHFTDYRQTQQFTETNSGRKYPIGPTVNYVKFNNELYTHGTGFSFQIGAIIKASKVVRLGIAYESPTWFNLSDEFIQSVFTKGYGLTNPVNNAVSGSKNTDPKIINVYDPYTLRTPAKVTGSFAYVFAKKGLFSIDYAIKDYSRMKFGPDNQFNNPSNSTNTIINNDLTNSSNEIRLGAEYKIKQLSLRGGYHFEQSPYVSKSVMSDLNGFSTGLGYNWGGTKLDLAYTRSVRSMSQSFFNAGLTDRAYFRNIYENFMLTLSFEM